MLRLKRSCLAALAAVGVLLTSTAAVQAVEWGTIEGQFVLDGDIPKLDPKVRKGDPTAKDPAVCAAEDVPDEQLVVDPETKGIANIAVYLRKAPADIHPDLKSSKTKIVEFDQKGCRYLPRMIAVRTDQQVECKSQDAVSHNVHISPLTNEGKNFIVSPNSTKGTMVSIPKPESLPISVGCDIHAWMSANWLVQDHPYMAVTDAKGQFKIENLPVGTHKFTVWQPIAGYIARHNFEVDVKPGVNKLPATKVPVDKFKLKK
jgi:hypothetical protein